MNAPVPHYDLLPLMWWENPWIVGGLAITVITIFLGIYVGWRIRCARKQVIRSPREQWLFDLHYLDKSIASQQCTVDHVYHELMRIVREYSQEQYALHNPSHTDEEFMDSLKTTTIPISESFVAIVSKIQADVYHVKFANTLVPIEYVQKHIHDLIACIEHDNEQKHDKNT